MEVPNHFHVDIRIRNNKIWLRLNHKPSESVVIPILLDYPWSDKMVHCVLAETNCKGYSDTDIIEELWGNTLVHQLARYQEYNLLTKHLLRRPGIDVLFLTNDAGNTPLDVANGDDVKCVLLSNILKRSQNSIKDIDRKVTAMMDFQQNLRLLIISLHVELLVLVLITILVKGS